MPDAYILGIESSCDETAAAVVRSGEKILSNVVFSQIAMHQPYGGVVPELASREHLRAIVPVVRKALADAGQTYESIDALAVTQHVFVGNTLVVTTFTGSGPALVLIRPKSFAAEESGGGAAAVSPLAVPDLGASAGATIINICRRLSSRATAAPARRFDTSTCPISSSPR